MTQSETPPDVAALLSQAYARREGLLQSLLAIGCWASLVGPTCAIRLSYS